MPQYDASLSDATFRITNATRTCDLILGVGDGRANAFSGFQYSPSVANVFDDTNLMPLEDWHPRIPHVVYWGMDWVCPNDNRMLAHQLTQLHGNLSAANTIRHIVPYVGTGDLHVAIYEPDALAMYVATAAADGEAGRRLAYQRAFVRLDLAAAFAEQPPAAAVAGSGL